MKLYSRTRFQTGPRLSVLSCSLQAALVAGLAAASGLAFSQASDGSTQLEKVVVTGTQIKRVDAETPSPVQVLSADDLKKSGYTTISDVLMSITANGAGTLSNSNSEAFAGGASGVALRGLSVGATLTLIDGHRMAPYPLSDDGERQFVDITNIPFDTIERIEVLKDGASAVYGSDAIAGVVNIILKKSYNGTTINAERGVTQHGGGATSHASIIHGMGDLESDGYNAYVALEFRKQDSIAVSQRSGEWLKTDWSAYGGNNITPGMPSVFNNNTPITLTPYLVNNANPSQTQLLGTSPCGALTTTAGCAFANPMILQPATQNINLLASFNKKLTDDWDLNVKASVFNAQEAQHNGLLFPQPPQQMLNAYPIAGINTGFTAFGPGMPAVPNAGFSGAIQVPANYAGNNNGASTLEGMIPGLGLPMINFDNYTYRLVADVNGTYGAWDVAASAGVTRIEVNSTYLNFANYQSLQNAVNAGTWQLVGVNSPSEMALVAPSFTNKATDQLNFLEAHASRELMKLAGGPLSMATGLSFVHKELNNPIPAPISSGAVGGTFAAYAMGKEDDTSAYAEFVAPVLKSLEVDAAVRADHYDTYGNSFTPKAGFKFKPMDELAFRGTIANGFRAPSPAENGTAGLTFGLGNPMAPNTAAGNCPGGGTLATDIASLCAPLPVYLQQTNKNLKPETSTSATLGMVIEPVKGWSSTIDYYAIKISNQIISLSELSSYSTNPYPYTNPTTGQSYCQFGPGQLLATEGPGLNGQGPLAMSSSTFAYCNSPYINANTTKTSGLDLESHYKFKFGEMGSLFVRGEYTHVLDYTVTANGKSYELAGTHGPSGVSGDTGNPRDHMVVTLSYAKGPLDVTTVFNRVGEYSVVDPSSGIPTCASALAGSVAFAGTSGTPPSRFCEVKAFLDTDVTVRYQWDKKLSLHASVMNLFDQAPPIDLQTYAGSFLPYNPSLHMAGVIGRSFNVGATYSF